MKASATFTALCLLAFSLSPAGWFPWVVNGQELETVTGDVHTSSLISTPDQTVDVSTVVHFSNGASGSPPLVQALISPACILLFITAAAVTPPVLLSPVQSDSETTTASSDCREEQFPCTRLYSVHKPVKQCISYLCVTSVRRMYIINKEVCSRIVCKENEVMQDEICRQLAGLPSRRLRRSGRLPHFPCKQILEQQRGRPDAL